MPKLATRTTMPIGIWPGTPLESLTHFWYRPTEGGLRRICDDTSWPATQPPGDDAARIYDPCTECRGLYVDDIVSGECRLAILDGPP